MPGKKSTDRVQSWTHISSSATPMRRATLCPQKLWGPPCSVRCICSPQHQQNRPALKSAERPGIVLMHMQLFCTRLCSRQGCMTCTQ